MKGEPKNSESKGLILSRNASDGDGARIHIRLDPSLDRSADLYDVFASGIEIEVLEIEGESVSLSVVADSMFKVDRAEKVAAVRSNKERTKEKTVFLEVKSLQELRNMPIEQLDERLVELRDKIDRLESRARRNKKDKSIAAERGYRYRNNKKHSTWIAILDEEIVLQEQRDLIVSQIKATDTGRKEAHRQTSESKREGFLETFFDLAREELDAETYTKLRDHADAKANGTSIVSTPASEN